jgi:hypothetical protein
MFNLFHINFCFNRSYIMITALDKYSALVLIDLQKGIATLQVGHPMAAIIENSAKVIN